MTIPSHPVRDRATQKYTSRRLGRPTVRLPRSYTQGGTALTIPPHDEDGRAGNRHLAPSSHGPVDRARRRDLVLRVHECLRLPEHTGDISRHIHYALLVTRHGLGVLGRPLIDFGRAYGGIAWSDLPYNYPIVTLFFFTAVSWISPTLFFVRLGLTAVEAVNAVLVGAVSATAGWP